MTAPAPAPFRSLRDLAIAGLGSIAPHVRDDSAQRFELAAPDPQPQRRMRLDEAATLVLDAGDRLADLVDELYDRGRTPPEDDHRIKAALAAWRLASGAVLEVRADTDGEEG